MSFPLQTFNQAARRIPAHGIGLSVDLFVPDLGDLVEELRSAALPFDYLEIFHAPYSQLSRFRNSVHSSVPLEIHGDGIWFVLPEFHSSSWETDCRRLIRSAGSLRSSWITHECATKEIGGRLFGTYIPPILSQTSARLTGRQAGQTQEFIGSEWDESNGSVPLLLIENPPFYSFVAGDCSLEDFFNELVRHNSCGLLLDIGHLYTYYLSSGAARRSSPQDFFTRFLARFPVERIIQIHLGGLTRFHETYFDDHAFEIPELLFELLEITLEYPGLVNLKGLALEVDNKDIPLIVGEYRQLIAIGAKRFTNQRLPL